MMFLLVYHVPVLCALTLLVTALRIAGVGPRVTVFELLPLAALLFAGPFCELAVGLIVGRAPRRAAWSIAWMTPIFFVFMLDLHQGLGRRPARPVVLLGQDHAVLVVGHRRRRAGTASVPAQRTASGAGVNRRRLVVFSALAMGIALAFVGFYALSGPVRDLEVSGSSSALLAALGDRATCGERARVPGAADRPCRVPGRAHAVLLVAHRRSWRSRPSPSSCCTGRWPRRLFALSAAMRCNPGLQRAADHRVAVDGLPTSGTGPSCSSTTGPGRFFALAYTMAGFFLMLFLILPSAKARIPRAARVSDVL